MMNAAVRAPGTMTVEELYDLISKLRDAHAARTEEFKALQIRYDQSQDDLLKATDTLDVLNSTIAREHGMPAAEAIMELANRIAEGLAREDELHIKIRKLEG